MALVNFSSKSNLLLEDSFCRLGSRLDDKRECRDRCVLRPLGRLGLPGGLIHRSLHRVTSLNRRSTSRRFTNQFLAQLKIINGNNRKYSCPSRDSICVFLLGERSFKEVEMLELANEWKEQTRLSQMQRKGRIKEIKIRNRGNDGWKRESLRFPLCQFVSKWLVTHSTLLPSGLL